jgi:hypothetical protein
MNQCYFLLRRWTEWKGRLIWMVGISVGQFRLFVYLMKQLLAHEAD